MTKKKPVTWESLKMRDYTKVTRTYSITEPLLDLFTKAVEVDDNMLSRSATVERLMIRWLIEEGYLIK